MMSGHRYLFFLFNTLKSLTMYVNKQTNTSFTCTIGHARMRSWLINKLFKKHEEHVVFVAYFLYRKNAMKLIDTRLVSFELHAHASSLMAFEYFFLSMCAIALLHSITLRRFTTNMKNDGIQTQIGT